MLNIIIDSWDIELRYVGAMTTMHLDLLEGDQVSGVLRN